MSDPFSNQGTLIGKSLGDYQLLELLTSGGMARIYKGFDARLQRYSAVKVLMRELMDNDDTLTERFEREARAIAALEHPHIVTVYQSAEQDGYFFMAMRFIEGSDLADELTRLRRAGQTMDPRRALHILAQVADALDYAHAQGIVHRDIKPSNVLLTKDDRAYLTDFGLALWESKDKTMGTAFGTPRYIAPEQALASEKAVPQSDIYALAVVLYEILTGDMLFRADTPMQVALSHISEPPPPPRSINPNIPQAVEDALLKALGKDPKTRQQTAGELIRTVKEAYENEQGGLQAARPIIPPPMVKGEMPDDNTIVTPSQPSSEVIRSALNQATDAKDASSASQSPNMLMRYGIPAALLLVIVIALAALAAGGASNAGTPDLTAQVSTQMASVATVTSSPEAATEVVATSDRSTAAIMVDIPTEADTETGTPTDLPSETPSATPSPTASHTATDTATHTLTPSATFTASHTPMPTITSTNTRRPTSTPSNTPTASKTPAPSATFTATSTLTATATRTPSPTLTPTLSVVGAIETEIRYDTVFLVVEPSQDADVRSLRFRNANGTTFNLSGTPLDSLAGGDCVVLGQEGRQLDATGYGCPAAVERDTRLPGDVIFWRGTAEQSFTVLVDDAVIAECPAVARGALNSCVVMLPAAP
jgi:serine/threonine-protein kinase